MSKFQVQENRSLFLESVVVRYSGMAQSKTAVLFLHGFPADSGKNDDIARGLAENIGLDCYVIHYRGLGLSDGKFSFEASVKDSAEFVNYLKSTIGYQNLYLVGHSFGGLVAINLLEKFPDEFRKIVLLAPFVILPSEEMMIGLFDNFLAREKTKRELYQVEELHQDLTVTMFNKPPLLIASSVETKCRPLVIQGSEDYVTPPEGAHQLIEAFQNNADLELIDDDHWFRDRERLLSLVLSAFGDK